MSSCSAMAFSIALEAVANAAIITKMAALIIEIIAVRETRMRRKAMIPRERKSFHQGSCGGVADRTSGSIPCGSTTKLMDHVE